MNDDDRKLLKQLKDSMEVMSQKVKELNLSQGIITHHVTFMRDQLSVMNEKLDEHSKILGEHTDKIDALMVDVTDVKDKVDVTYDLVKAIHEHDQRDIAEIKEHLGLPHTSSPFKS